MLVATNSDSRVTLYHKRDTGHVTTRYMSIRHMFKLNHLTQFVFSEAIQGTDDPLGDRASRVSAPS